MTPRTIHLVSCTKSKLGAPAPARDLYTASDWFRRARAYVEAHGDDWYILSAEHGLLHPDTVIAPYETSLLAMDDRSRLNWATRVNHQLMREALHRDHIRFVILAGHTYRERLEPWLNGGDEGRATVPMRGLGMGEQKAWLAAQITAPQLEGVQRAPATTEAINQRLASKARARQHQPMAAGSLFDEVARNQLEMF